MDRQAFDLMMSRFDNIDRSIGEVKTMQATTKEEHDVRLTSLEETRTKQRTAMTGFGIFVTAFSTVCSWLASK